ncbi:MAG: NERD domain-containing protein [Deltaproteobacteria bacterium]|nr:NERD domain-containing protein [Deltaproteobacteria bacterium]
MISFKARIKGFLGEKLLGVLSFLFLKNNEVIVKNDIVIPAYDKITKAYTGTTQIDQIVISKYGIFVIEIKTYKGWIFGSKKASKWTQVLYKIKNSFQNPLHQNYKHIKSLKNITGISESKFISVIVFWGAVFKTQMPENVLQGMDYINYIKSFKKVILTEEEIKHIIKIIYDNSLPNSAHRKYIKNYHKKV